MTEFNERTFPIKVLLDGQEFIHFSAFTVTRSVTQFIDTFTLTCNNPGGRYSSSIPIGAVISFWHGNTEFFRGYVEKKGVQLQEIGSMMSLGGREEIVSICETDIDVQKAQFKNTTDNAIINKMLAGFGYQLQLGTAFPVKEYAGNSGMKVAQVVEDITKYSDSVIIKKGNILIKRKLPTGPSGNPIPLRVTKADGTFSIHNSKILEIELSEDISQARGYMVGYSYQRGKSKKGIYAKTENKILTSGNYAKKLRNQTKLKGTPLKNNKYFQATAKEQAEAQAQVIRSQRETDIDIDVTVTLAGIFKAELLDTVDVFLEQEGIQQFMYIEGIQYSVNSSNKAITILKIKPFPSI